MTQPVNEAPQIVPPDKTDELAATIAKLLRGTGRTASLEVVPKGYLTSGASAGSAIAGILMFLTSLYTVYTTSQPLADMTQGEAFGTVLVALAAIGHGIGRKIDRKLAEPAPPPPTA
jgi:hypothetical protein